jgi:opacity protein-like surface antigen
MTEGGTTRRIARQICTQREIREGRAPRRLGERTAVVPVRADLRDGSRVWRHMAVAIALTCLVIASKAVYSDDFSPPAGPYIGAGWGQFDLHLHNLNDVGTAVTTITHSSDDSWKAFVGFRFAPFIAVEAAYVDFGHSHDSFTTYGADGTYHLHLTGFSPTAIATLPLGPVEIFGKAGYYFYNVNTRVDFSGGPFLESQHDRSDFLYGGGAGVTVLHHLNVRAEYERIDLSHASGTNAFWISPSWRF